jgi:hypothetical protein
MSALNMMKLDHMIRSLTRGHGVQTFVRTQHDRPLRLRDYEVEDLAIRCGLFCPVEAEPTTIVASLPRYGYNVDMEYVDEFTGVVLSFSMADRLTDSRDDSRIIDLMRTIDHVQLLSSYVGLAKPDILEVIQGLLDRTGATCSQVMLTTVDMCTHATYNASTWDEFKALLPTHLREYLTRKTIPEPPVLDKEALTALIREVVREELQRSMLPHARMKPLTGKAISR